MLKEIERLGNLRIGKCLWNLVNVKVFFFVRKIERVECWGKESLGAWKFE